MSWGDNYTRMYIGELQGIQRQINFLQKALETSRESSIESATAILRNSQDKLYNLLSSRGVTPEDAYRIITEDGDKELLKDIIALQKARKSIEKQLTAPKLTPEKRQALEASLSLQAQDYKAAWLGARKRLRRELTRPYQPA